MMTLKFYNNNEKFEGEVLVPKHFEEYLIKEADYIEKNVGRFAEFIKIEGCDYITAQKIIFLLRNGEKLPSNIEEEVSRGWNKKTIWSTSMEKDKENTTWLVFNPYTIKGYSINYNIYNL